MKTFKLIPLLAAIPFLANANVVLQSDGNNLLVNSKAAQLVSHLYDADSNKLTNVKIVGNTGTSITALVTFDGKAGLFDIQNFPQYQWGYGYSAGYNSDKGTAVSVYDASCNRIGVANTSLYSLGYIVSGGSYAGDTLQAYSLGSTVTGYDIRDLVDLEDVEYDYDTDQIISATGDCSQGTPITGYAVSLDSGLSTSVNNFFNSLKYPLHIK